ncbi:MAG: uroporphyrinogen decarboxylase family protein [Clostridia bacterium]|nr:uroporphyrinogen decarboxylase family protein [Clostridia bacterium]
MKEKAKKLLEHKERTLPILSFPVTSLLGITVEELISSAKTQALGMKTMSEHCHMGAVLNMMDLSVESECFGAKIRFEENDVPTVAEGIIDSIEDAESIVVPSVNTARAPIYVEGVRLAKEQIKDLPVFCGALGPYSLAGRLFDMSELMMECYDSPDEVKILLSKATEFIKAYILEYKAAGADGVILAEPAAGLLSPSLAAEFSAPFVKEIIDAVSDDDFIFCYHNCGGAVVDMADSIAALGADIYHFGNAINLADIIDKMPKDSIVMGNLNPLMFRDATPDEIRAELDRIYNECSGHDNFMISSGCDVPHTAKWENIDAYFNKVKELYA